MTHRVLYFILVLKEQFLLHRSPFAVLGVSAGGQWRVGHIAAVAVAIGGVPVVGARQPAIATPTGGTVVDAEARATVAQLLAALRAHGLIAV